MKKSDIAMIILIASASVLIAFFVVRSLPFFTIDEKGVDVPTVEEISSDVVEPSKEIFNEKAINPTVPSVIGGGGSGRN